MYKENFGGNVCGPYKHKEGWKDKYEWILNSPEEIQLFLEKVYKYLIIKKRQAQIVLTFINKDWFDKGENLFIEIRMLNSEGKGLTEEQVNGFNKDAGTSNNRITEKVFS